MPFGRIRYWSGPYWDLARGVVRMTPKEIADKMPPEERAKYILSLQPESTRKAMERPVEDDLKWFNRPIPANYLAVPDAKTTDELVGARALGYEESKVMARLRYNRGRYLAEMRGEGEASSVTEVKRNAAVAAFMFVKTKFKDLMRMCGLATEKEYAEFKREK